MAIKIGSLARWKYLKPNSADTVVLPGKPKRVRRVRIQFNVEADTRVYRYLGADSPIPEQEEQLLAAFGPGLHVVEFQTDGDVEFFAAAADGAAHVWYQTAEEEPTFARVIDPVIFTRIANRRHRNPELEEMMYRMQMNVERRLAAQAAEFEAALERRREYEINGRPSETVVTDAPGAVVEDGAGTLPEPEPAAAEDTSPKSADEGGQ